MTRAAYRRALKELAPHPGSYCLGYHSALWWMRVGEWPPPSVLSALATAESIEQGQQRYDDFMRQHQERLGPL